MASNRVRKTVRFTPEDAAWLEQRAKELGVSQSAYVRSVLDEYLPQLMRVAEAKRPEAR